MAGMAFIMISFYFQVAASLGFGACLLDVLDERLESMPKQSPQHGSSNAVIYTVRGSMSTSRYQGPPHHLPPGIPVSTLRGSTNP